MVTKPTGTLVDRVFDQIFEMIVHGEITFGGTLNEAALADRFAVSRGPVREAIKRLQGLGLVTKEPYLKARLVNLTIPEMIQIFQLREAVEGMSVRLATQRMSDAEIARLLSDFSEVQDSSAPVTLDVHVRIAEACGNERVRKLLCDELYHLLRLYRSRSGSMPGRRADAHAEHWQILRSMRARDADLAESLMRAHIARATKGLERLLSDEQHENLGEAG